MKAWITRLSRAALAVALTVGICAGGILAYHWQMRRPHQAALEEALDQSATLTELAVRYGPTLPPTTVDGVPCPAASAWGGLPEVARKCAKWPTTRTFLVQSSEFIYIIYFDAAGRMRDFTLVEN